MAGAKIDPAPDLWLMDDSIRIDPSDLDGFSVSAEIQSLLDVAFDGPSEKTQAA